MDEVTRLALQHVSWFAGFWLCCFSAAREDQSRIAVLATGLLLAAFSGRALAQWLTLGTWRGSFFTPFGGGTLATLPLGVALAVAATRPWTSGRDRGGSLEVFDFCLRHAAPGLALARLGCFLSGCCFTSGLRTLALFEALLYAAATLAPSGAWLLLVGGAWRGLSLPLRAGAPLEFQVSAAWVWFALGVFVLNRVSTPPSVPGMTRNGFRIPPWPHLVRRCTALFRPGGRGS